MILSVFPVFPVFPVPQFLKRDGSAYEAIKGTNGAMLY